MNEAILQFLSAVLFVLVLPALSQDWIRTGTGVGGEKIVSRIQLADDLADRGLGAVKAESGTGEAALLGNGEEGFELVEFHNIGQYKQY